VVRQWVARSCKEGGREREGGEAGTHSDQIARQAPLCPALAPDIVRQPDGRQRDAPVALVVELGRLRGRVGDEGGGVHVLFQIEVEELEHERERLVELDHVEEPVEGGRGGGWCGVDGRGAGAPRGAAGGGRRRRRTRRAGEEDVREVKVSKAHSGPIDMVLHSSRSSAGADPHAPALERHHRLTLSTRSDPARLVLASSSLARRRLARRTPERKEISSTHLTMHSAPACVLWPSSMRTLTSRSAVLGTPSSSSSSRIFLSATIVLVASCARGEEGLGQSGRGGRRSASRRV